MASANISQPTESAEGRLSEQLFTAKVAACSQLNSFKATAANNVFRYETAVAGTKQCVRSARRR